MKINIDYDDSSIESGSDTDSSIGTEGNAEETKANSGVLVRPPLPSASSDDDDSEASSVSDASLLGEKNPVTALKEQGDWQFETSVMENQKQKMEEQTENVQTFEMSKATEDMMPTVSALPDELSVISMELENTNEMIKNIVEGKENEIKEFRSNPIQRSAKNEDDSTPTDYTNEHLEKRKKERAARLARARERIARDKQKLLEDQKEEERKRKEEEAQAQQLDMSDEGRRNRAYQWYSRCGQPKREELKRRIANLSETEGLSPDDVNLLPWNFNGTAINVAKMMRYQNMVAA